MNRARTKIEQLPLVEVDGETATEKPSPLSLRCRTEKSDNPLVASVEDRQGRVPGFSQKALSELTVLLVGAGAMGGEIAEGLVRKGVGTLKILDFDTVTLSNLNRQFFFPEDLHHPKAWALARNLEPHGAMGTKLIAWNVTFEQAQERDVDLNCNVAISAVDDDRTRVAISKFAMTRSIPALFGGASTAADNAYVFVQETGGACFGCAFPDEVNNARSPCPGSPAIKDLFKGLACLALYATDSLVMQRPRRWQLYILCPADATFTVSGSVDRRPDCALCGGE